MNGGGGRLRGGTAGTQEMRRQEGGRAGPHFEGESPERQDGDGGLDPEPPQEREAEQGSQHEESSLGPEDEAESEAHEPSRGAAIVCYVLVALVAVGLVLGPVGTLLIWRMRRGEAFLDHHGRQALDIFLTALLLGGGLVVLARVLGQVVLEWAGFAVVGIEFLLAVAGATMAARGSVRALPLVLPILRRRMPSDANRQSY